LKFFGGISAILGILGVLIGGFVTVWYALGDKRPVLMSSGRPLYLNGQAVYEIVHRTSPFTSLITVAGVLFTLSFLLFAVALLADMLGRHRRISEELLYLARRRIYSSRRSVRVALSPEEQPHGAMGPTLHDSWSLPVIRTLDASDESREVEHAGANGALDRDRKTAPARR